MSTSWMPLYALMPQVLRRKRFTWRCRPYQRQQPHSHDFAVVMQAMTFLDGAISRRVLSSSKMFSKLVSQKCGKTCLLNASRQSNLSESCTLASSKRGHVTSPTYKRYPSSRVHCVSCVGSYSIPKLRLQKMRGQRLPACSSLSMRRGRASRQHLSTHAGSQHSAAWPWARASLSGIAIYQRITQGWQTLYQSTCASRRTSSALLLSLNSDSVLSCE
mmetsp:Transcript_14909/g.40151  ORF Transcript_14909/g.40151 Transcript_14909/m.40151 type:complete len:217 (+) Transcript_14909:202-852(+)